ncbi:MAG TPA: hypothetical protein VGK73_23490 [Polyangiaceae bacterium]
MRCLRQLVLGALVVAGSARARAESTELPLELDWQAPPECYTAEMIRAELARIATVRPGRTPAKLGARGRIERVGEQYRLSLRLERDGHALERRLAASECRALGREVTLLVALAFGEGVELVAEEPPSDPPKPENASPESAPGRKPAPEPLAATPENTSSAAARDSAEAERLHAAAFLGGGVFFGVLPGVAARAFAGADVGSRRAWLAPRIDVVLPVSDSLERGVDARYDGLGGGLSLCLGQPALDAMLAVCATAGGMALRGHSSGATESLSAVAPWYTAGAAVSAAWPERGLIGVRLEAALLVSLNRPRFVVEGLGQVHQSSRLVPAPTLSLLLRP